MKSLSSSVTSWMKGFEDVQSFYTLSKKQSQNLFLTSLRPILRR